MCAPSGGPARPAESSAAEGAAVVVDQEIGELGQSRRHFPLGRIGTVSLEAPGGQGQVGAEDSFFGGGARFGGRSQQVRPLTHRY